MASKKILFVGCGKMGRALLEAWTDGGGVEKEDVFVLEKDALAISALKKKGVLASNKLPLGFKPYMVVLCVKPSVLSEVLPLLNTFAQKGVLFFSIVAGKKIAFIEKYLGADASVVRCMPNLCVEIKKGASGMYANSRVNAAQKKLCFSLMQKCAFNIWLEREEQLNAATSLAGSAPAYMAYFISCMGAAGLELGLKKEDATSLALATMAGTAELLKGSKMTPSEFISCVATPGGTTEAAMREFERGGSFKLIIEDALKACAARSKEISQE